VPFATTHGRVLEFYDDYLNTEEGWRLRSRVVRPILQPQVWP
jgi:hypothetical protein